MRIRHLSTEELLLQCEGELGSGRASHLDECEACRTALVDLVELLGDAEQELRGTVPSETVVERAAAWDAIEQRISKPATVITFPVRWAAAYAAAAALGFAVLSGIVESDFFAPGPASEPVTIAEAVPEPPAVEPLPAPNASEEAASVEPEVVPQPAESTALPATPAVSSPTVAEQRRLDRYAVKPLLGATPSETALPVAQPPAVTGLRPTQTPFVFASAAPVLEAPVAIEEAAPVERRPLTLAAAREVIEGYWILHRAQVWREDVVPAWTPQGLVFKGTVENEQVRSEVTSAIRSVAKARQVPVDLRLRAASANGARLASASQVGHGVPGGVMRRSLLEHYSDAARRSFASTEPSALEGELDRFVNDVFENQSNLLAHAYGLKALVSAIPANLVPKLASTGRFEDLVAVHTNAVRRHQAQIYDLLSEALPRKYWTYKAKDENVLSGDLQADADALLKDALELDANLTALLSTPQHLLDVSDSDVSCGEALSRIRTRLGRIQADTAKLR